MVNPTQKKEENPNSNPPEPKKFTNFAHFFKGYMNVSTIVVAALPIAFNELGLIPGFAANNKFLPIYTSLFCFLILAFSFFSRYRLAWWMFHNELNGRSIGFARPIKTVFRFIPFLLIGICFSSIIWYHNILDKSVETIKCELNNPPCNIETPYHEYFKSYQQYVIYSAINTGNNQKFYEEYMKSYAEYMKSYAEYINSLEQKINPDNSLKYFGQSLNTLEFANIEDFEANTNKLDRDFILRYADPSMINNKSSNSTWWIYIITLIVFIAIFIGVCIIIYFLIYLFYPVDLKIIMLPGFILILISILLSIFKPITFNIFGFLNIVNQEVSNILTSVITNNSLLIISYLAIFISAETAFILMALREYLQEVLDNHDDSDLFRKVNAGKLNTAVCQSIKNQDSREICYFFLENNAKLEYKVYQKKIIDEIDDDKYLRDLSKKRKFRKSLEDAYARLFDGSIYRENKISRTLNNVKDPNQISLDARRKIDITLKRLKEPLETLNKWEKIEEVDDMIKNLEKLHNVQLFKYLFQYLDLFSDNSYDKTDYYLSLESGIKAIEEKEKNGLSIENVLREIQKSKEKEEKNP